MLVRVRLESLSALPRCAQCGGSRKASLVILDNLATHKNPEAEKAMRQAGCWFVFLPPYSPDLNPIEMAFSKLKAHLRRIGARTFTDMFNAIAEICDLYSPEECWNYFTAAGYVSG
ncbi:MAG: transposase [Hoeflea sp. D1-CHI-28]